MFPWPYGTVCSTAICFPIGCLSLTRNRSAFIPLIRACAVTDYVCTVTYSCADRNGAPGYIICIEAFLLHLSWQFLQPLPPFSRKVKKHGCFHHSMHESGVKCTSSERLNSLTNLGTMGETPFQFASFPSYLMPSLEHLSVHNYQLNYSAGL